MKSIRLIIAAAVLGMLALPALAFQETTKEGGSQERCPVGYGRADGKARLEQGKGLTLSAPGITIGKSNGTEVRIPGIGTVGVLPQARFRP